MKEEEGGGAYSELSMYRLNDAPNYRNIVYQQVLRSK
jgi:hypothetical protein